MNEELSPGTRALLRRHKRDVLPSDDDQELAWRAIEDRILSREVPMFDPGDASGAMPPNPVVAEPAATAKRWVPLGVGALLALAAGVVLTLGLRGAPLQTVHEPSGQAQAAAYEAGEARGVQQARARRPEVAVEVEAQARPVLPPQTTAALPQHQPAPAPHSRPRPRAKQRSRASADGLRDEARLLSKVRAALREQRPKVALRLAREHAHRFPRGSLVPERQLLTAVANCEAGQTTVARAAARKFIRQHPGSPLVAHAKGLCKS